MIVAESDLLTAALDRRLQVDRLLAVDALAPISGADGESRPSAPQAGPSAAAAADSIAERLPLGQNVTALVVEVPSPNHVVAEIAGLVVTLAWPGRDAPAPGGIISLRVLSHSPLLLFESALVEPPVSDETDTPTRLSPDAIRAGLGTPIRFRTPILEIEIEPIEEDGERRIDRPDAQDGTKATAAHDRIALDDVIVARSARVADDRAAPASIAGHDPTMVPTPLILEGPAWQGQDVELIVRRERADESFDNPVLDQWCGDLVIDLPSLGRVAGHLAWSMQGLRIRLEGQDRQSVSSMNAATAELARALASVDLPVLSMSVSQPFADIGSPRHG
jgi:hypothetical protein